MSKYELQKLFFKKLKKLLMTLFFRSRYRSWSRSQNRDRDRSQSWSRKIFCGLIFGLGRVGLDYSPGNFALQLFL